MIRKNIANSITSLRIILLPLLIYFVIIGDKTYFFWLSIFIIGTDAIDGTVARIFKQESEFGRALDSIADFGFYPIFFVGNILLLDLLSYVSGWVIIAVALLPMISTWGMALVITGRLPFFHLRTWQATTYFFLLFTLKQQ